MSKESILKSILGKTGNPFASTAETDLPTDTKSFIDTGSHALNALLSGKLRDGGIPDNKIVALAGDPATGKTFLAMGMAAAFQRMHETGLVFYFDSEQAVTREMFQSRGFDLARLSVLPVGTIEDFRHQCMKVIDSLMEIPESERPKALIILDSLGNLSTAKETTDISEGNATRDMTKAGLVRGAFRALTIKLGVAKIPLIVTNHTYDVIGCLSGEVEVLMVDGNTKPISQVSVGDVVKTLGGSAPVDAVYSYTRTDCVEVELDDGTVFVATPNHKFMTRDGRWVPIEELAEGEEIAAI